MPFLQVIGNPDPQNFGSFDLTTVRAIVAILLGEVKVHISIERFS